MGLLSETKTRTLNKFAVEDVSEIGKEEGSLNAEILLSIIFKSILVSFCVQVAVSVSSFSLRLKISPKTVRCESRRRKNRIKAS